MQLGLLGFPLGHSFSKAYFENKFAQEGFGMAVPPSSYRLFAYANIRDFSEQEMVRADLHGFNVTIPYKTAIIPFLDRLDATATDVGAVNTVVRVGEEWLGCNTDVIGFEQTLQTAFEVSKKASTLHKPHLHFFVLGNGGASQAVQYVLRKQNLPFTVISRQAQDSVTSDEYAPKSYVFLHNILCNRQNEAADTRFFIINTTPLGTAPNVSEKPAINYAALLPNDFLLDLVYNPTQTAFLAAGLERGCLVQNGLEMLHAQAEAAAVIWGL